MRKRHLLLLPLVPVVLVLVAWAVQPWPLPLRWVNPSTSAYMDARTAEARVAGTPLEIRHQWVPLEEIPEVLIRAVLVAEDDRFRDHGGVDWEALSEELRYRGSIPPSLRSEDDRDALRASWEYLRENREAVRGRSTITQQLARNLYLSPDRSFIRKGQELLLARRLEFFLSKDRILELYLNLAEFGPGVFGVGAASEVYFDRAASELTRHQAASLAATLPHPLTSNPSTNPGRMAWRRDLILGRLAGGAAPVPPAPVPTEIDIEPPPVIDPPDSLAIGTAPEEAIPSDSIIPDTVQADTVRADTVQADTVPADGVQAHAIHPDSVPPDSIRPHPARP